MMVCSHSHVFSSTCMNSGLLTTTGSNSIQAVHCQRTSKASQMVQLPWLKPACGWCVVFSHFSSTSPLIHQPRLKTSCIMNPEKQPLFEGKAKLGVLSAGDIYSPGLHLTQPDIQASHPACRLGAVHRIWGASAVDSLAFEAPGIQSGPPPFPPLPSLLFSPFSKATR